MLQCVGHWVGGGGEEGGRCGRTSNFNLQLLHTLPGSKQIDDLWY